MQKIPFSKNNISKNSIENIREIFKSGWLTHGKYTELFEKEFIKITKSKYALTVSSCTAGLHLSCIAANFKKGDEVIVPAMSHTATSHAVEYTGAKVVFADIDLYSGNISLDQIKKKITRNTKGLILVHMVGLSCDMKNITKLCRKKNIKIIEDCAHSLGSKFKLKTIGNFGLTASFSFYPTKQITTGEGGMVTTNSKKIFKKIKILKAFGIDKDIKNRKIPGHYDVKNLGFNYRMTDFQAAIGYDQAKNYKKNLITRKKIAKRYHKNLISNKKINIMPYDKNCSYFVYQIFVEKRNQFLKILKKNKIGFSIHYAKSLPEMTYYKKKYKYNLNGFPNSIKYAKENISLPIYPKLKLSEVDKICYLINNFYK